jgi:DNA-directed RNA polymerase subunit RPC12/RpoP
MVPEAGAWTRCPECRERFFLKTRDADSQGPDPAGPARVSGRTAEEQRLLDRQRAKMGRPRAEASLEMGPAGWEVAVFPALSPDYRLYGLAAALVAGVFLGVLVHIFQAAWISPAPAPAPAPLVAVYREDGLDADLAAMRRDFSRRRGLSRNIGYQGREVRVFKYFMAQMAPGACEFSSLRLWSTDTGEGFKAVGACLDQGETPELAINWQGGAVQALVGGGGGAYD